MRYAALGDSFSAGVTDAADEVVWTRELARALGADEFDLYAEFGVRSGQLLEEQAPRLAERGADLVTLVCGGNDVLLHTEPDIAGFHRNLLATLDTVLSVEGARVVMGTYADFARFVPFRELSKARVRDGMEAVHGIVLRAAAAYGLPCVDVTAQPWARARESFLEDGVHLTADGHRRAARLFEAAIAAQLVER
jgi:lysophospholipase L1-like esterase